MRVLLSGYYGFSNAGDEAVLDSIITGLRLQLGDGVEITVLSASPAETEKTHAVRAVSRAPSNIRAAVRDCDLLISGGGSLIQDATSFKSLLYYLAVIRVARAQGCRVMVLGQGIGPLRRNISRTLTKSILNRVDLITVRDEDSVRLLEQIGVTKPAIHLTADPAFVLDECSDEETARLLSEAGVDDSEDLIAVSMRTWPDAPEIGGIAGAALRKLSTSLPAKILLLAMQMPGDMVLAASLHEAAPDTILQPAEWTPRQIRGVLGRCKLAAGMRLHTLILASSAGTPCLGISYDPKVESFLSAVDQPCIPLTGLTSDLLTDQIEDAWNKREFLSSRLAETAPPMKQAALRNFELVADLLGQSG
jgi:polysaccharide pyruvyl transferase CsaB